MAPYGRFTLLTDEHVSLALVSALRKAGRRVHRVEDERGLGKGTLDDRVFACAAERGRHRKGRGRAGASRGLVPMRADRHSRPLLQIAGFPENLA